MNNKLLNVGFPQSLVLGPLTSFQTADRQSWLHHYTQPRLLFESITIVVCSPLAVHHLTTSILSWSLPMTVVGFISAGDEASSLLQDILMLNFRKELLNIHIHFKWILCGEVSTFRPLGRMTSEDLSWAVSFNRKREESPTTLALPKSSQETPIKLWSAAFTALTGETGFLEIGPNSDPIDRFSLKHLPMG